MNRNFFSVKNRSSHNVYINDSAVDKLNRVVVGEINNKKNRINNMKIYDEDNFDIISEDGETIIQEKDL